MRRLVMPIVAVLTMLGCATNPLPDDYSGPKATLRDTVTNYNGSKADYFFLYQYNGRRVRQSYDVSVDDSRGMGFTLAPPVEFARFIPIEAGRYYLIGRTHYAAPIQELAHGVYLVKGEVTFTPRAGATYVIRGVLSAVRSEVWIEDAATGELVSEKLAAVSRKGSRGPKI